MYVCRPGRTCCGRHCCSTATPLSLPSRPQYPAPLRPPHSAAGGGTSPGLSNANAPYSAANLSRRCRLSSGSAMSKKYTVTPFVPCVLVYGKIAISAAPLVCRSCSASSSMRSAKSGGSTGNAYAPAAAPFVAQHVALGAGFVERGAESAGKTRCKAKEILLSVRDISFHEYCAYVPVAERCRFLTQRRKDDQTRCPARRNSLRFHETVRAAFFLLP